MAIVISPGFISGIADNPEDFASGLLTPSRHNLACTLSGLTANALLYSTDGTTLAQDGTNLVYTTASGPRLQVGSGSTTLSGVIQGYSGTSAWSGLWHSAITPNLTNPGFGLHASGIVFMRSHSSGSLQMSTTVGGGAILTAGTATTDVNALSATQTANNAAVVDFLKFTWTVTSAAAAASYLRILAGTAGTSPVLVGRKTGDLEIGTSAITAAQGYSRVSIKHATTTLSAVSGATATATNLIPAKANVLGVNTLVTTGLGVTGGTTGYTVGDGTDADRWGAVTGTAAGTDTDGNDATADPTGWFNAANNVVITAAGGNFDGTGAIFVDVAYTLTEAD